MANYGTANNKGRSSGKSNGREGKIRGAPEGSSWVWLTFELLSSDAWRSRSRNCIRLIDRLILEHMAHAGRENGSLIVTYNQFKEFGVRRNDIKRSVDEAVAYGLLRVTEQGGFKGASKLPNRYRLTFLPSDEKGYVRLASNEWKSITDDHIKKWEQKTHIKKQNYG